MSPAGAGATLETLPNGLRLLLAPATTAGTTAVAVHAGVGFRGEPADSSGLAHLFEHLMFAGSAGVEPGGHFAAVEAVGGAVGGHTRHDYTELFEVVPAHAVDEVVRLEVDRLAGPRLDPATLATQVEVIRAEIAQQVDGVPYGGFPWRHLPPAMFDTSPHVRDGYGDVAALRRVGVDDAAAFFDHWWAPGNLVVTVEGDLDHLDVGRTRELLSALPARAVPPATPLAEPALAADRHLEVAAANVPAPVWAAGFRLPDPALSPRLHGACTALAGLLPAQEPALRVSARSGWYGVPLDARDPDVLVLSTHPRPGVDGAPLLAAMRDLLAAWAPGAATPALLGTARTRLALGEYARGERLAHRARRLGAATLLLGSTDVLASADPTTCLDRDLLGEAAAYLLDQHAGTVLVTPGPAGSPATTPGGDS
ncbi:insulinase family protein [Nocardioides zeae]|uniref:Insulinase family protein n=1 Tax=Nocardioides imazamoxiresistens TaxID=3231893 RepID=A0ABU3PWI4_9ACTN|nr:insulinase family protein [Nocardioides zeae]MDT9593115.1 insulinase family protein [Nocardioides zeae]